MGLGEWESVATLSHETLRMYEAFAMMPSIGGNPALMEKLGAAREAFVAFVAAAQEARDI